VINLTREFDGNLVMHQSIAVVFILHPDVCCTNNSNKTVKYHSGGIILNDCVVLKFDAENAVCAFFKNW